MVERTAQELQSAVAGSAAEASAGAQKHDANLSRRARYFELPLPRIAVPLGQYQAELLNWGQIEPHVWQNEAHSHSHFELCYCTDGRGTCRLGNQQHEIAADGVFLSRPGEAHCMQSSEDEPLGICCATFLLAEQQQADVRGPDRQVNEIVHAILHSNRSTAPAAGRRILYEMIGEEISRRQVGFAASLRGLFGKILLDAGRALIDSRLPTAGELLPHCVPDEIRIQLAIRFIEDNFHRPITVRDVAAQIYLSERHTSRLFHKVVGTTVLKYITELRMKLAMQLLLEPGRSVREVAHEAGFPDARYFITRFGQLTGMTPSEYRRNPGAAQSVGQTSSLPNEPRPSTQGEC